MATPKPASKSNTKPAGSRPATAAKRPRGTSQSPEHEGATEAETGDRTGPGAGYDAEPEQVDDKGGVAS